MRYEETKERKKIEGRGCDERRGKELRNRRWRIENRTIFNLFSPPRVTRPRLLTRR
jgi:hypothetical protein